MHARLAQLSERVQFGCLFALLLILPALYLPFTLDSIEIQKQTFLVIMASLIAISNCVRLYGLKSKPAALSGPVKSWLLFAAFISIASIFSLSPYRSWVGGGGQLAGSAMTLIALAGILFSFSDVLLWKDRRSHAGLFWSFFGAVIAFAINLLASFGFGTLEAFRQGVLTTAGSPVALGVFASGIVGLSHSLLFNREWNAKRLSRSISTAALFLGCAVLLRLNDRTAFLLALIGLLSHYAFFWNRMSEYFLSKRILLSAGMLCVVALCLFTGSSWVASSTWSSFSEVVPGPRESVRIARDAVAERHWIFGSGPATFDLAFAKFKDPAWNGTGYWDTRFSNGFSFYTDLLATAGPIGALLFLAFIIAVANSAARFRSPWIPVWIVFAAASALGSLNLLLVVLLTLAGGFVSFEAAGQPSERKRLGFFSGIQMCGALFLSFAFLFLVIQRYGAESAYANGVRLERAGAPIEEVIRPFETAASYNRWSDTYPRALSKAYLFALSEQLNALDPIQVTQAQQNLILALGNSSIEYAKTAAGLCATQSRNWEALGRAYRELDSLRPDELGKASDAMEKAVALEPSNPALLVELAASYASSAEQKRLIGLKDGTKADSVAREVAQEMQRTRGALERALILKPEYAPALYQLAVLDESEGNADKAILALESIVKSHATDVGVRFQLGISYLRRAKEDDLRKAKVELEACLELAPSFVNARWFLASIFEKEGDAAKAIEQVERVAELDSDNPLVNTRLERLRRGVLTKETPPALESTPVVP